jgi:lipoprotein-releasing system permease protein
MRLAFSIAMRFLRSGGGQTLLIALGISVGVAVQVFIGSLIQGLQISLVNTTIGSSSQITITSDSDEKLISDWERVVYEVRLMGPDVKYVSPAVSGSAFVESDEGSDPVLIRGFNLADSDPIYKYGNALYEGRLPSRKDEVIVGRDLSVKTGFRVGDRIWVLLPTGDSVRLYVSGLFDLNVQSLNRTWLITNLETAQGVLGLDSKVSAVEMQVSDEFSADALAGRIKALLSEPDLIVDNWKDQNRSLLSGLNGQSVSSLMIQVFVLIAVLLGIASVLAISVVQRSKQLGILKAMGIRDRDASLIFIFQGGLLGILGGALGIAFGYGLLISFTTFAVNEDGSPVVPIFIDPGFLALSGTFALVSAMVASAIPARLSGRLNPIEVIKNG